MEPLEGTVVTFLRESAPFNVVRETALNPRHALFEPLQVCLDDDSVEAVGNANLADASAHDPTADDADGADWCCRCHSSCRHLTFYGRSGD